MIYNPYSLKGKTILITGASSGIGHSTAIECSKMGATVIITARNKNRLNKTFEELEGKDRGHQQFIADMTDSNELINLVEQVPVLDGFVNSSGVMKLALTQFITELEIDRIHKINLVAPMMLTKHLVKKKKMRKPSSIVYAASAGGVYRVSQGNGIYATTKCGIDAFMRTTALELGSKGIRCNSVNPGMVETDLIKAGQLSEEQLKQDKKRYPLGRYGKPIEIAHAIIYLLSDASLWITGTALKIDGGMTLS